MISYIIRSSVGKCSMSHLVPRYVYVSCICTFVSVKTLDPSSIQDTRPESRIDSFRSNDFFKLRNFVSKYRSNSGSIWSGLRMKGGVECCYANYSDSTSRCDDVTCFDLGPSQHGNGEQTKLLQNLLDDAHRVNSFDIQHPFRWRAYPRLIMILLASMAVNIAKFSRSMNTPVHFCIWLMVSYRTIHFFLSIPILPAPWIHRSNRMRLNHAMF